jgi:ABC-type nitrate/sulfonate/bicarbonate transport system ATPase subunit
MVFQQPRLLDWRSVRTNVDLAARAAGLDDAHTPELLRTVGLLDYADVFPSALSGGRRQRPGIAAALAPLSDGA